MRPITEQQKILAKWLLKATLLGVKIGAVVVFLLGFVLICSQSAVAPVSGRLLGIYAVEYTMKTVKPYRHFFPKPYLINLEEETR